VRHFAISSIRCVRWLETPLYAPLYFLRHPVKIEINFYGTHENVKYSLKMAAEGGGSLFSAINTKPVPMKLFSTWEVDKSVPSCIPRL